MPKPKKIFRKDNKTPLVNAALKVLKRPVWSGFKENHPRTSKGITKVIRAGYVSAGVGLSVLALSQHALPEHKIVFKNLIPKGKKEITIGLAHLGGTEGNMMDRINPLIKANVDTLVFANNHNNPHHQNSMDILLHSKQEELERRGIRVSQGNIENIQSLDTLGEVYQLTIDIAKQYLEMNESERPTRITIFSSTTGAQRDQYNDITLGFYLALEKLKKDTVTKHVNWDTVFNPIRTRIRTPRENSALMSKKDNDLEYYFKNVARSLTGLDKNKPPAAQRFKRSAKSILNSVRALLKGEENPDEYIGRDFGEHAAASLEFLIKEGNIRNVSPEEYVKYMTRSFRLSGKFSPSKTRKAMLKSFNNELEKRFIGSERKRAKTYIDLLRSEIPKLKLDPTENRPRMYGPIGRKYFGKRKDN